jgi:hypothetical protein
MVDIEVVALASSAATVLAEAMVTDAWEKAKQVASNYFGSVKRLDELQREVVTGATLTTRQAERIQSDILAQIASEDATKDDLRELNTGLLSAVQQVASMTHQVGATQNYGTINQQGSGVQTNITQLDQPSSEQ